MKRNLLFISCCMIAFCLSSCGTSKVEDSAGAKELAMEEEKTVPVPAKTNVIIGMANPYYNFDTLEEAAEMAGFSMTLPSSEDLPDWIIRTDYRATKTSLMEIIYPGDEDYSREIRFRKAITDKEDMSGDYNSYESESVINVNGRDVTIRMNGDKIYVALWRNGEFAYSARVSDGMTEEELTKLISLIE